MAMTHATYRQPPIIWHDFKFLVTLLRKLLIKFVFLYIFGAWFEGHDLDASFLLTRCIN